MRRARACAVGPVRQDRRQAAMAADRRGCGRRDRGRFGIRAGRRGDRAGLRGRDGCGRAPLRRGRLQAREAEGETGNRARMRAGRARRVARHDDHARRQPELLGA